MDVQNAAVPMHGDRSNNGTLVALLLRAFPSEFRAIRVGSMATVLLCQVVISCCCCCCCLLCQCAALLGAHACLCRAGRERTCSTDGHFFRRSRGACPVDGAQATAVRAHMYACFWLQMWGSVWLPKILFQEKIGYILLKCAWVLYIHTTVKSQ